MRRLANIARAHLYNGEPTFKLAVCLRGRIRKALRGISKSDATLTLLGCSLEELKAHLESQFLPGMTWKNYGYRGWHVDHARPCASFDLTDSQQQAVCFNYRNLRPMWRFDNQSKGSRVVV